MKIKLNWKIFILSKNHAEVLTSVTNDFIPAFATEKMRYWPRNQSQILNALCTWVWAINALRVRSFTQAILVHRKNFDYFLKRSFFKNRWVYRLPYTQLFGNFDNLRDWRWTMARYASIVLMGGTMQTRHVLRTWHWVQGADLSKIKVSILLALDFLK